MEPFSPPRLQNLTIEARHTISLAVAKQRRLDVPTSLFLPSGTIKPTPTYQLSPEMRSSSLRIANILKKQERNRPFATDWINKHRPKCSDVNQDLLWKENEKEEEKELSPPSTEKKKKSRKIYSKITYKEADKTKSNSEKEKKTNPFNESTALAPPNEAEKEQTKAVPWDNYAFINSFNGEFQAKQNHTVEDQRTDTNLTNHNSSNQHTVVDTSCSKKVNDGPLSSKKGIHSTIGNEVSSHRHLQKKDSEKPPTETAPSNSNKFMKSFYSEQSETVKDQSSLHHESLRRQKETRSAIELIPIHEVPSKNETSRENDAIRSPQDFIEENLEEADTEPAPWDDINYVKAFYKGCKHKDNQSRTDNPTSLRTFRFGKEEQNQNSTNLIPIPKVPTNKERTLTSSIKSNKNQERKGKRIRIAAAKDNSPINQMLATNKTTDEDRLSLINILTSETIESRTPYSTSGFIDLTDESEENVRMQPTNNSEPDALKLETDFRMTLNSLNQQQNLQHIAATASSFERDPTLATLVHASNPMHRVTEPATPNPSPMEMGVGQQPKPQHQNEAATSSSTLGRSMTSNTQDQHDAQRQPPQQIPQLATSSAQGIDALVTSMKILQEAAESANLFFQRGMALETLLNPIEESALSSFQRGAELETIMQQGQTASFQRRTPSEPSLQQQQQNQQRQVTEPTQATSLPKQSLQNLQQRLVVSVEQLNPPEKQQTPVQTPPHLPIKAPIQPLSLRQLLSMPNATDNDVEKVITHLLLQAHAEGIVGKKSLPKSLTKLVHTSTARKQSKTSQNKSPLPSYLTPPDTPVETPVTVNFQPSSNQNDARSFSSSTQSSMNPGQTPSPWNGHQNNILREPPVQAMHNRMPQNAQQIYSAHNYYQTRSQIPQQLEQVYAQAFNQPINAIPLVYRQQAPQPQSVHNFRYHPYQSNNHQQLQEQQQHETASIPPQTQTLGNDSNINYLRNLSRPDISNHLPIDACNVRQSMPIPANNQYVANVASAARAATNIHSLNRTNKYHSNLGQMYQNAFGPETSNAVGPNNHDNGHNLNRNTRLDPASTTLLVPLQNIQVRGLNSFNLADHNNQQNQFPIANSTTGNLHLHRARRFDQINGSTINPQFSFNNSNMHNPCNYNLPGYNPSFNR